MKKLKVLFFLFCLLYQGRVSAVENPLFHHTHLLPSPFTLPQGRVLLGSTLGVGVFPMLEIQTNLISDFLKIYNVTARSTLLDFPGLALSLSLGYQNVGLQGISPLNPDVGLQSWLPGAVLGIEIFPYIALFLGGHFNISNPALSEPPIVSGYLQGGEFETDISYAYHPTEETVGSVLSVGFTYNTSYRFYGLGISHHWEKLHLGIHWYPNASQQQVMPILTFNTGITL